MSFACTHILQHVLIISGWIFCSHCCFWLLLLAGRIWAIVNNNNNNNYDNLYGAVTRPYRYKAPYKQLHWVGLSKQVSFKLGFKWGGYNHVCHMGRRWQHCSIIVQTVNCFHHIGFEFFHTFLINSLNLHQFHVIQVYSNSKSYDRK